MYACANLSFLFKEAGPIISRHKAAASKGFRFVENDFPTGTTPDELGQAVKESGVTQVLINCFHGDSGEMGFAATPGKQEEFKNALNKTFEYTRATNCKKIHILSGHSLGKENLNKQVQILEENLLWANEVLQKEGVIGLIEPINPVFKPGYFLNSYEIAVDVIKKINSPNIRLQLDLFHLQMICGNVSNNIKRLLPYTGHVQVAQSPDRFEPSFEGELNMKYVFNELQKAGYEGPVGCEYIPSKSTEESLSWIKDFGLKF
ncbi:UNVERIFIED_CONTAM: hypothetical protein RMT77_013174 [Armadillidium vulgare]